MRPISRVTLEKRALHFKGRLAQFSEAHRGKITAYFCMEYGLPIPIYSGGLGMLAGDTLRSAADLKDPLIGVGLLYRNGYYTQEIADGHQVQPADAQKWNPARTPNLFDLQEGVDVNIFGNKITFRLWGYEVQGEGGGHVPLLLLDSAGFPNHGFDYITRRLYLSNPRDRLAQEIALGIGGMRALEHFKLPVSDHHLNEGHAAFAPLEFLSRTGRSFESLSREDLQSARRAFSFTTHTPVPAGFDRFEDGEIKFGFFGEKFLREAALVLGRDPHNQDYINMAYLAMRLSGVVNGVSILHAEVSEKMFPEFRPIIPITNGVHHLTWVSEPVAKLLTKYCPTWRVDPESLIELSSFREDPRFREELFAAHQESKAKLLERVRRTASIEMDPEVFTIGFARRFATYKRGDLLFLNSPEILRLAEEKGRLQIIFAGKPHPNDGGGLALVSRVIEAGERLNQSSNGRIKFVFLPNYNLEMAQDLVAGVDVWLNTPMRPHEASGTSGMKAALNGVPHLSTEDGWWEERRGGGWTINEGQKLEPTYEDPEVYQRDSSSLHQVLDRIIEAYYKRAEDPGFLNIMFEALAQNGSFFNTHRMVKEYRRRVFSDTRVLSATLPEPEELTLPPYVKLINLGRAAFDLRGAASPLEVEKLVAQNLIKNLPRSFRVSRYLVHKESVRIDRRWLGVGADREVIEERRDSFGQSGFEHWRQIDDFKGEVMADLLGTGKIQIISDPKNDPRCFRDGHLVSENPFILIPEFVGGKVHGVYKMDFRPGVDLDHEFVSEFTENLVRFAGFAKTELLSRELQADLSSFSDRQKLINWVLTLMTAGGFQDMPRYAIETNRVAFFSINGQNELVGSLAIGETTGEEFRQQISGLSQNVFTAGVRNFLREYDQSRSALNSRVNDRNLGPYVPIGPLLIKPGLPEYDPRDFSGEFDQARFAVLREAVEAAFQVDGKPIDHYLLMPVVDTKGNPQGLIYADNAFTGNPLSIDPYRNLAAVFAQALGKLIPG